MKDETNAKDAYEFVGLRSKMYSLALSSDGLERKSTAKGIPKSFVKHSLPHQAYVDCMQKEVVTQAHYKLLQSQGHVIRTRDVGKIGLSPYDDKRYIDGDTHFTKALGHVNIRKN